MTTTSLDGMLREALEAAKGPESELRYKLLEEVDTENETAVLEVRFSERSDSSSISLERLVQSLKERGTISAVDIFGPPDPCVVVLGAVHGHGFKVSVQLG